MSTFKQISFFVASGILLFTSCTSTTLIQTTPGDAKVYINSEYRGKTPYNYSDSKIVGSSFMLRLEKDGYRPLITTITKDEEIDPGAIVGGLFFGIPFLWTMRYQPLHTYELVKLTPDTIPTSSIQENITKSNIIKTDNFSTKTEKLRELKKLLDEKIITQAEFDKEKARILALPD